VSAFHFFKSLQKIKIAEKHKKYLVSQLFSQNSLLRWSWSKFQLYEIVDQKMYDHRLFAFSKFYNEFYENERNYDLDPTKQFDVFDYPEFNVTFVAFNSCYNNDIFNKQAAVHPVCMGDAATTLRNFKYQDRLRIALWHHNTEGIPSQLDYIDPDILQNFIEAGFSLGLHGHQHKPQFMNYRFRYGGDRKITVISAGTLCGGSAPRFGRACNIIELDIDNCKGLLHSREMQNDNSSLPIWNQRPLPPNRSSFLKFTFDQPPEPFVRATKDMEILITGQDLYADRQYKEAAAVFKTIAQTNELGRRLMLDCYGKIPDFDGIADDFDPPQSNTELLYLLEALWETGKHERLASLLKESVVIDSSDPSINELREKYEARLIQ